MTRSVDLVTLLAGADPEPTQPVIAGRESDVDRLIRLKRECEKAEAEFKVVRRELEMAASNLRVTLEEQGKFTNVITLQGTTETLTMSYTDQMKTVDVDEAPIAKQSIGRNAFGTLFQLARGWQLRAGSDLNALRALIKKSGGDPTEFIVGTACYRARDGFRKLRFELRAQLTSRQNVLLDLLVSRLQYEPRLGGVKWAWGAKMTESNSNGEKG